jgi:hypothetical protein
VVVVIAIIVMVMTKIAVGNDGRHMVDGIINDTIIIICDDDDSDEKR